HAASRSLPTGAARYRTGVAGRTEPELVVVDDPAEEARRLFLDVAPRTFVLSGGRTPEDFYRLLAATDHAWSGVEVFFGDERCVPRVTLTVPALSGAVIGAFLVQGASKRAMVERLLAGADIPAARLAPERLLLIADPAAAPG